MIRTSVGQPINIGGITVVPLEEVKVVRTGGNRQLYLHASKKCIGIVFSTPEKRWAVNIEGKPIALEVYLNKVEGLQQVLDRL